MTPLRGVSGQRWGKSYGDIRIDRRLFPEEERRKLGISGRMQAILRYLQGRQRR